MATSTSCFFGIDGGGVGLMAGGELKRMHPVGLKVEWGKIMVLLKMSNTYLPARGFFTGTGLLLYPFSFVRSCLSVSTPSFLLIRTPTRSIGSRPLATSHRPLHHQKLLLQQERIPSPVAGQ